MAHNKLQIGELADLLDITTKAIRHYHKLALLPEPERDHNGYRLYRLLDLRRLQEIQRLQGLGLSLRQIKFTLESAQPHHSLIKILRYNEERIAHDIQRLQQQQASIRVKQAP